MPICVISLKFVYPVREMSSYLKAVSNHGNLFPLLEVITLYQFLTYCLLRRELLSENHFIKDLHGWKDACIPFSH